MKHAWSGDPVDGLCACGVRRLGKPGARIYFDADGVYRATEEPPCTRVVRRGRPRRMQQLKLF